MFMLMKRKINSRFKNKVILITGGSRGIGFAAAQLFLQEGGRVVICSRSQTNVRKALGRLKSFGKRIDGVAFDVSLEVEVESLMQFVKQKFGRLDVVVNAAGMSKPARFEKISVSDWHEMLDHNLTNTFLVCKRSLGLMKKQRSGKIVNVSSIAGRFRSKLAGVHYTCAKAALIALTRQLAAEVGPYHINVNVVCPSQTKTEMLKPFLTPAVEKKLKQSIPLGYIAEPKEQAEVILFLSSDEASYMTGAVVDVNGGQL